MPEDATTTPGRPPLDVTPLLLGDQPWWAPRGGNDREAVTLHLPSVLVDQLAHAEQVLGLAASDLVAAYVERAVVMAMERRQRFLDMTVDHSRIATWMPDGTPSGGKDSSLTVPHG
jgi:hypothetical protein